MVLELKTNGKWEESNNKNKLKVLNAKHSETKGETELK